MGPPWIANAQFVYLGSIESLSNEERAGLTEGLKTNAVHAPDELED